VTGGLSAERENQQGTTTKPVGRDMADLRFIASLVNASGRRLVIEDFHYLSQDVRRHFAFELKTLWDYELFVVVVGVWNERNLFLNLNHDLSGRVQEVAIDWAAKDLRRIFKQGGDALNLEFSDAFQEQAITDCFKNAGILQRLILDSLDEAGVHEAADDRTRVDDQSAYETSCMGYAEELNAVYQAFAQRVASGIRNRQDSTGIYAHAMAVVLDDTDDEELVRGVPIEKIYAKAHARQSRIQKGNLNTILGRIESMQVDDAGRGLVLAYNQRDQEVTLVDRQLLLYRRYSTVKWPWEDLVNEAEQKATDEATVAAEPGPESPG
jgi:hypothetical protein